MLPSVGTLKLETKNKKEKKVSTKLKQQKKSK